MKPDSRLDFAISYLQKTFPMVASGLLDTTDASLAPHASRVLDFYFLKNGDASFEVALDAFAKLSVDLLVSFTLSGVWHGAQATFVIFGFVQGGAGGDPAYDPQ
jgi:hypothetical protein